ncbi:MAG: PEP-CTERM sorting domain-containing protein [Candidatus Omnitrophota bacterium]|jgi:hypothetical protein|nr:MAG: PEP-CTERM sorting domain-containing protein [Candidatus Omnitrophota bacterium]
MLKLISIVLAILVLTIAISADIYAYTVTYLDPYSSATTLYSAAGDRIGNIAFELYKVDVTKAGNNLTFDIYSNYSSSGYSVGSWHTMPADLALDVNNDGTYDYGVAFRNHDGLIQGKLYSVSDWYISGYDRPGNGFIWHHGELVSIKDIDAELGDAAVTWNDLGGSNPHYKISTVIDMNDFLPNGYSGDLGFFYGGATCANDYIGGIFSITTPEPASLSLFGLGLLGLIIRRKK